MASLSLLAGTTVVELLCRRTGMIVNIEKKLLFSEMEGFWEDMKNGFIRETQ